MLCWVLVSEFLLNFFSVVWVSINVIMVFIMILVVGIVYIFEC